MTPEEHLSAGEDLLVRAEFETDLGASSILTVRAQAHFAAAQSGAAVAGLRQMRESRLRQMRESLRVAQERDARAEAAWMQRQPEPEQLREKASELLTAANQAEEEDR